MRLSQADRTTNTELLRLSKRLCKVRITIRQHTPPVPIPRPAACDILRSLYFWHFGSNMPMNSHLIHIVVPIQRGTAICRAMLFALQCPTPCEACLKPFKATPPENIHGCLIFQSQGRLSYCATPWAACNSFVKLVGCRRKHRNVYSGICTCGTDFDLSTAGRVALNACYLHVFSTRSQVQLDVVMDDFNEDDLARRISREFRMAVTLLG